MNKYQKALSEIGNIVLDGSGDGYHTPKYLRDFYFMRYGTLKELVNKAESFEWIPLTLDDEGVLDCPIPEVDEEILVTDGKHVWEDTWIEYDDGYALDSNYELDEVTAWMPLPKPYKENQNDLSRNH